MRISKKELQSRRMCRNGIGDLHPDASVALPPAALPNLPLLGVQMPVDAEPRNLGVFNVPHVVDVLRYHGHAGLMPSDVKAVHSNDGPP
jgi:hypothetical protein